MDNKKSRRSDNEAEKEEEVQQKQEVKKTYEEQDTIIFDVYFQGLLRQGKVLKHHRLPMKKYVESKGIMEKASREVFEQILKTY